MLSGCLSCHSQFPIDFCHKKRYSFYWWLTHYKCVTKHPEHDAVHQRTDTDPKPCSALSEKLHTQIPSHITGCNMCSYRKHWLSLSLAQVITAGTPWTHRSPVETRQSEPQDKWIFRDLSAEEEDTGEEEEGDKYANIHAASGDHVFVSGMSMSVASIILTFREENM